MAVVVTSRRGTRLGVILYRGRGRSGTRGAGNSPWIPFLWKSGTANACASTAGYFPKAGMLSGGAGDLFFGMLNASCCALGFRMFYNRDILSRNLVGWWRDGWAFGPRCLGGLLSPLRRAFYLSPIHVTDSGPGRVAPGPCPWLRRVASQPGVQCGV